MDSLRSYIYNKVRAHIYIIVSLFSLSFLLSACVSDGEESEVAVSQYTDDDVKSYGDLFEVFWRVMSQRYNYLNEQQGAFALDWEQVYHTYKPKFDALQTFDRAAKWTNGEIQADHDKAKTYFTEIVNRIVDQHFLLRVKLPISHATFDEVTFRSGMENEEELSFPLKERFAFMQSQLATDDAYTFASNDNSFCMLGGFLKEHRDVYYLGFSSFAMTQKCYHAYHSEYLPYDANSTYRLTEEMIADAAQRLLPDASTRHDLQVLAVKMLRVLDDYMRSDVALKAKEKMEAYAKKGEFDGLVDAANQAMQAAPFFMPLDADDDTRNAVALFVGYYMTNSPEYQPLTEQKAFFTWLVQKFSDYLCYDREYESFCADLKFTTSNQLVESYPARFLRPLVGGKISKLILDLRGNGGGSVSDVRLLADYFINHSAVYAYVRMKEDSNPYSYTPWIPQTIQPNDRSIGRDIPIVVLLDKGSASMSEGTTLMLKSQGEQVKVVGRNSAGATAMLNSGDVANGGWIGNVTSYLYFYMPFMAVKDSNHRLLEGVGITPDYLLEPISQDEKEQMQSAGQMSKDRFLEKAVDILQ